MYPYDHEFTDQEKQEYINKNCNGWWSGNGIAYIQNDPNLTYSQKEEMQAYLRIYG